MCQLKSIVVYINLGGGTGLKSADAILVKNCYYKSIGSKFYHKYEIINIQCGDLTINPLT